MPQAPKPAVDDDDDDFFGIKPSSKSSKTDKEDDGVQESKESESMEVSEEKKEPIEVNKESNVQSQGEDGVAEAVNISSNTAQEPVKEEVAEEAAGTITTKQDEPESSKETVDSEAAPVHDSNNGETSMPVEDMIETTEEVKQESSAPTDATMEVDEITQENKTEAVNEDQQ